MNCDCAAQTQCPGPRGSGSRAAVSCKCTRREMLGHLRAMQRTSLRACELAALMGGDAMSASTWRQLLSRRKVAGPTPAESFIVRPWSGPLSVPQRAVARQIKTPLTWKLLSEFLQPVDFRSSATTTIPILIEGHLAGAFLVKCHMSPYAQATAPVRR